MSVAIPFPLPATGFALNSKVRVNLDFIVAKFNEFNTGTATWDAVYIGTGGSVNGALTLYNSTNGYYTTIQSGVASANQTYTWPTAVPGGVGSLHSTNSGVLSWEQSVRTADTPQFAGLKLTGVSPTSACLPYLAADYTVTALPNATGVTAYVRMSTTGVPAVASLLGTSNQITVTYNAGDTTLSLPQSIATGSVVNFAGVRVLSAGSAATPEIVIYQAPSAANTGLYSTGADIRFATAGVFAGAFSGPDFAVAQDSRAGRYFILESGGGNITIANPGGITGSYTLTLPVDNGGAGQVLQTDGSGTTSWMSPSANAAVVATAHYTGFPNRTDTALSFNDGTATLSLTCTNKTIWLSGTNYTISTLTKAFDAGLAEASGLYWFWITAPLGVPQLNYAITAPGFDKCLVATVYWNTTTNKGLLADERHWMGRDQWMHEYLHETVGARYYTGLTGTFGDTTFSITAGEFYDEDIEHVLSSDSPMAYPGTAMTTCKVLYHNGSDEWQWDAASTTPYKITTGNLRFNTGTTLSTAAANKYVNYFVYASNLSAEPIFVVVGTAEYTTANAAAVAPLPSLGTLVDAEVKLIYKITYKNDGTPTFQSATDFRTSQTLGTTASASDHGALTGLTDDDHAQYWVSGATGRTTNFKTTGTLEAGATTLAGDLTLKATKNIILTDDTTNTVTLALPAAVTSYTLTLPVNDGGANEVLQTDGSGVLSWASPGSGSVASGVAGTLALYPATAAAVDDVYVQNAQNISVAIAAHAALASTRTYTIPEAGASASFVMTEGTQTIGGVKTFTGITNIGGGTVATDHYSLIVSSTTPITDTNVYEAIIAYPHFQQIGGTASPTGAIAVIGETNIPAANTANWTATYPVAGLYASVSITSGATGTLNAAASILANKDVRGMTITNNYGLYIYNPYVSGGAITNNYGLYIETPTAGSTLNHSLYVAGGLSSLGGTVVQPTQPSFLVTNAAGANDVTGDGTVYTVAWPTEIYDQGANFASNTFTAPVTGRYALHASILLAHILVTHSYRTLHIVTSNRTYKADYAYLQAQDDMSLVLSCIADMDANDTATVAIELGGSTKTVDQSAVAGYTMFSGSLIN